MSRFGWNAYQLRAHQAKSEKWAFERWFLMHLHNQEALDELSFDIATYWLLRGQPRSVRLRSIWVDGSPIVKGNFDFLNLQSTVRCELADLLFILDDQRHSTMPVRTSALLLQAKVAHEPNLLPNGGSTLKERRLLEGLDRSQELSLYPAPRSKDRTGSYVLAQSLGAWLQPVGMLGAAQYLLFPHPLSKNWQRHGLHGPFQVGWPSTSSNRALHRVVDLTTAIRAMSVGHSWGLGRTVHAGSAMQACGWSRLIHDLQTAFDTKQMKGFNGQQRTVRTSNWSTAFLNTYRRNTLECIMSLAHSLHGLSHPARRNILKKLVRMRLMGSAADDLPPPAEPRASEAPSSGQGPGISIFRVSLGPIDRFEVE